MRSISPKPNENTPTDDRTTKARIRDAAIDCFAEHGVIGTTARKIAIAAGVSPGLVIHHYESMEGLRHACDTYVAESIRRTKQETVMSGTNFDVMSVIRNSKITSIGGYLASALVDDSPAVAELVDNIVTDAETYMQMGVEAGTLQHSKNPKARATVMSIWTLGALVLHRHMQRLMGINLTDLDQNTDETLATYLGAVYEIMGNGILTESASTQLQNAVAGKTIGEEKSEPTTTSE